MRSAKLKNALSSNRTATITLLLGAFITMFDLFVVNVALPTIQIDLDASLSQLGLIIAAYEIGFGGLLIASGRLGDIYGHHRLYLIGIGAFTVMSFLCGVAPSIWFLIAARFAQGITAALLFPQIYTLLRILFQDLARSKAFALLGMTLGLAAIAGQVFGGLFVELDVFSLGWRPIFLVNIPIGMITLLMCYSIPLSKTHEATTIDGLGTIAITVGLICVLFSLLEGTPILGQTGFWICLLIGLFLIVFFLWWEWHLTYQTKNPLIDFHLFSKGGFSKGLLIVFIIYSTSSSLFLCFALLVQQGFQLTPFAAGMLFASASAGFLAGSLIAPKLINALGYLALPLGMVLYAAGILFLIGLAYFAAYEDKHCSWMLPALMIFGVGQGMSMTQLLNFVLSFIEDQSAGMASGLISTMQQIGAACGVVVVSLIFSFMLSHQQGDNLISHINAFSVAMIYNVAVIILSAMMVMKIIKKPSR